MHTLQEILKTARAFIAAHKITSAITITVAITVVVGTAHSATPQPYPVATQQGWLTDCESLSFNTPLICGCELSYFEGHVTAQQFEQDYSAMPPGIVPPELSGAEACSSG